LDVARLRWKLGAKSLVPIEPSGRTIALNEARGGNGVFC